MKELDYVVEPLLWPAQPNGTTISEDDKRFPSGGFKSFGHFCWSVMRGGRKGGASGPGSPECKAWEGLLQKRFQTKTDLIEENDPLGGLLVPPLWSRELYQRTYDQNQILKYLDPVSIEGKGRIMNFPALKEDSRADGYRHGGVTGLWEGEADQYTQKHPVFRNISTQLHKMTAFIPVTNELIEDVPQAIESYLMPLAASEINFQINRAVVSGNGVGMPLGIMDKHVGSRITVTATGGGSIMAADIINMVSRINIAFRRDFVWLLHPTAESQLIRMLVIGVAATGSSQYAAANLVRYDDDGLLRIMGRPALLIEQCSAVGTEGDIIAFAPRGYKSIVKRGIESFMSVHLYFDYDQSVFKFRFRFDGHPADDIALTPYQGSVTTSSIVTLNSSRT